MDVSIILCVYNSESTLALALDSIAAQSYGDYELVVVNDGSTDSSLDILNSYQGKFKRMNLVSQVNQGLGASRNRGLSIASHEYVSFIDADDVWHPRKLELQVHALKSMDHADIVICDNKEFVHDCEIDEFFRSIDCDNQSLVSMDDVFFQLAEVNFNFAPATALCRKAALVDYGGFTGDKSGQDYYPFLVAALHRYVFCRLPLKLYGVRVSENSLSRSSRSSYLGAIARVNAIERIIFSEKDKHIEFLTQRNLASLEMGREKFLRWALSGIRRGCDFSEIIPMYFPVLAKIRKRSIWAVEVIKLIYPVIYRCNLIFSKYFNK